MSQIIKDLTAGPVPPSVPTSFETQNGTAVPAANILIVHAIDSTEDNDNGIIAKGGVVGTGTSNEVDIVLTNRLQGQVQTTDATPTTIISFPIPTIGSYIFEIKSAALNTTDSLGAGYSLFGTARSNGVDSFLCGTPDKIVNEETGMGACDFNMTVGGIGDPTVYFQVTGLGTPDKEIEWCSVGLYCMITE